MSKIKNPLRLALDVWNTGSPDPRGIVTFLRLYAKACAYLAGISEISLAYTGTSADRVWLHNEGLLEQGDFHFFRFPGRLQRVAARCSFLPWGKIVGDPDIFHSATLYPFRSRRMHVIGTLVDFVPMRLPELVPVEFVQKQVDWCRWAARHPEARWIAISDQTRRDALALARLKEEQVVSINLCADEDMFSHPPTEEITATIGLLNIQRPFLLCVNTLNLRKNHTRLLEAWEMGKFSQLGWTLVLVGHAAGHPSAERLQKGEYKGVTWLGYLSRQQLIHLYYGCEAVLNPSLYEGFGLSTAEALVAGKPVLVSQRSPMADIARDGAIQIDPWDTESLCEGLSMMIHEAELRRKLAAYNWSQRDLFSIQRLAADLLSAYRLFFKE